MKKYGIIYLSLFTILFGQSNIQKVSWGNWCANVYFNVWRYIRPNTFIADSIAEIRYSDDTNDLVWCGWYVFAFDGIELNEQYRELAFDFSGYLELYNETLPKDFAVHPAFPNPFNPTATLRYDLPENSLVNVTVYDMLGRQVKTLVNQTQDAGYRSVIWNATKDYGKPVSAGIYLYQIQAGEYISTKKMVLLK